MKWSTIFLCALLGGCAPRDCKPPRTNAAVQPQRPAVGSADWYQQIDAKLSIGDAQGHGPDPGSAEWMDAVSNKLYPDGHAPDPGTDEWLGSVDHMVLGPR